MFADEQISRKELEILQLERLKKIVAWSFEKSAFYRRSFQSHGITPEEIQSLADVSKLPLLTSDELRTVDAFDFLTLPLSSVVRINQIGGVTKFYTRGDIRNNVEMMIRTLIAANVLRGSIVGLGGDLTDSKILDALYALESIGATVIPLGTNHQLAQRFTIDTLIGTAESIASAAVNASKIFCMNENFQPAASTKTYNLFAPPELAHAGFCCCCECGRHVQEDHFLPEILNGELVITTLTAQAMPLIRWRTGQSVRFADEPCSCGRSFMRIVTN